MKLVKAIEIANVMYMEKKSSWGEAFIFHTMRVAMKLKSEDEQIVALLQYLPEVTSKNNIMRFTTLGQLLRFENFTTEVIEAIECIVSLEEGETDRNVNRIKENQLVKTVMIVTLEDLLENEQDEALLEEYKDMHTALNEDAQDKLVKQLTDLVSKSIDPLYFSEHQIRGFLDTYSTFLGINLNTDQETIVREALSAKFTVINGGAGTGVVQTIHAIRKGVEVFDPRANVLVVSGAGHKGRSYLQKRLQADVEVITSVAPSIVENADVIIIHDASKIDVEELDALFSDVNPKARIIFTGDFAQIPDENGMDFSKLGILPSFELTVKMRVNHDSSVSQSKEDGLFADKDREEDEEDAEEEEREEDEDQVDNGYTAFLEILTLINDDKTLDIDDVQVAIDLYEQTRDLSLSLGQRDAIARMFENRVLIHTGEAGSGLTESVKAIVECLKLVKSDAKIQLVTGRGNHKQGYLSKRTGVPQSDIVGICIDDADLVIIEEAGLIDTEFLDELLDFVSQMKCRVLIVGSSTTTKNSSNAFDIKAIIASDKLPTVQLQTNIRNEMNA